MKRIAPVLCVLAAAMFTAPAGADDLTRIIQQDLTALGYEPGAASGEMTTQTVVAITKFQADNGMEITGEVSPQLAGVIKARLKSGATAGSPSVAATSAPQTADPAAAQAAQQACLQKKIADAQEAQKKKRGFGSLMSAVSRTAGRFGGQFGQDVAETTRDIYDVNATVADLESAAKDLGLTESDLEQCRNAHLQDSAE